MFEQQFNSTNKKSFGLFRFSSKNKKLQMESVTEEWLLHIRARVKPSTLQKYQNVISKHLLPAFGSVRITQITRAQLTAFGEVCIGQGLKEKTANDILGVLRMIFRYAEEEYDLLLPKIPFFRQPPKETRVLSQGEEQVLLQYILKNLTPKTFGILLTLYTGLRIGELCALTWEDVSEHSIRVTKTLQRLKDENGKTQLTVGNPKSLNSFREIPVADCLQPYISLFRKPTGYVLQTKHQTPTEPRTLQAKFQRIVTECGLSGVTFHTLRHTFATRCVEAGFDMKSLSEILGHRDVKTTLNLYVHPSFDFKKENMEKLAHPLVG